jgi:hypothetical protein
MSKVLYNNMLKNPIIMQHNYKPGDIIAFKRRFYSHYGIYIGDDKILHKDNHSRDLNIFKKTNSNVSITDINSIYGIQRLANDEYKNFKALPFEESLELGLSQVGQGNYNLLLNNCEHFVTHIRFQKKISKQIRNIQIGFIVLLVLGTQIHL